MLYLKDMKVAILFLKIRLHSNVNDGDIPGSNEDLSQSERE
jgi:hypothetical protein